MAQEIDEIKDLPCRYVFKKSVMPYDLAKEAVNRLAPHVTNANRYRKWIKDTKSYYMPYHPERYYENFTWKAFLRENGGKSEPCVAERTVLFAKKRANYLPMWEAIRWSQRYCRKHGIKSYREWMEAYKADNNSTIPDNIPYNPKYTYENDDWPGVKVWLGVDAVGIQEAAKHVTPMLTLVHPVNAAQNVVQMVVWGEGIGELRMKWKKQADFDRIIGCWEHEKELMPEVDRILSENAFSDGERWTTPNLNQLTWELNSVLMMVRL